MPLDELYFFCHAILEETLHEQFRGFFSGIFKHFLEDQ